MACLTCGSSLSAWGRGRRRKVRCERRSIRAMRSSNRNWASICKTITDTKRQDFGKVDAESGIAGAAVVSCAFHVDPENSVLQQEGREALIPSSGADGVSDDRRCPDGGAL